MKKINILGVVFTVEEVSVVNKDEPQKGGNQLFDKGKNEH